MGACGDDDEENSSSGAAKDETGSAGADLEIVNYA